VPRKAAAPRKPARKPSKAARKPASKAALRSGAEPRKGPGPMGIRTAPKGDRFHAPEHAIRKYALSLPQAYEDFPWGHRAFRVNKKVFVFLAWDNGVFSLTAKLPQSQHLALSLPFVELTGYGMGRSGWVTARFSGRDAVPVGVLCRWIDESYRAVAPSRLAALLEPGV
jgi:predicted DNA-binding protein (MmcQ/YjbR family)